jgi:hypothetical protein
VRQAGDNAGRIVRLLAAGCAISIARDVQFRSYHWLVLSNLGLSC